MTPVVNLIGYPIYQLKKGYTNMTDFTKYKNISVKKDTYSKIDVKIIVDDDPEVSYSQVVTILVNKEYKRLER